MSLIHSLSDAFARKGLKHDVSSSHAGTIFSDQNQNPIFSYRMREYPSAVAGTALLESFTVGEKYRGNGQKIGGMAIRQIASYLEREGMETLGLFRVQDDGITFWPRQGALPHDCKRLGLVMAYMHSSLPEGHSDRAKAGEAAHRIAKAPEATWFEMTDPQSDIGLSRETMQRVSRAVLADQTYVFEFDRPEVRTRLALG